MIVVKFGGTSVKDAVNIKKVIEICKVRHEKHSMIIVVSAFATVTNTLTDCFMLAEKADESFQTKLKNLEKLHLTTVEDLFSYQTQSEIKGRIMILFNKLDELLQGVYCLGECSEKTKAKILSFGERMSSIIISEAFKEHGIDNSLLDSAKLIKTNTDYLKGTVDFEATDENIKAAVDLQKTYLAPGFVSSDSKGDYTLLGRGGSDYTASIYAAAIEAKRLEIWTDVDGVKTSDPNVVEEAYTISRLSYEEAMELSYFGAKVIYAPTIHPILKKNIPVLIKNTFNPSHDGTLIDGVEVEENKAVKGLSCVKEVSLISVTGSGMVGVPNISKRVFKALSEKTINVLFISQASSEHSICIGIAEEDAENAREALSSEFEFEIFQHKINPIQTEKELSIIAIVGNGMRNHMGTAGRAFQSLGNNGINIIAIAQGSSERNISIVINRKNANKALNVLHESFFLSQIKKIHLFMLGVGNVGSELLSQIKTQNEFLKTKYAIELVVVGIANSKKMLINPKGINTSNWKEELLKSLTDCQLEEYLLKAVELNLRNSVMIDNTASELVTKYYNQFLSNNISIIASNKIAASSSYQDYSNLKTLCKKKNLKFLYETNVAAGLPIINTIKDLVASGDKVLKIEAVLSGSLNYIFNTISKDIPFSQAVKQARELGFTEPDPRIDLSGKDVMRKILILSREAGSNKEFESIENKSFLPDNCFEHSEWSKLFVELQKQDKHFEELRQQAESENKKLRVVAKFVDESMSVALEMVDGSHPAYQLNGKDNIVLLTTERYKDYPLVIKGAGAGAAVTASGVFADIMLYANA